MKAAIVIPLYKPVLNELEDIALAQAFRVFSDHHIVAVKPERLSLEHYSYNFNEVISFDNMYFENIQGYNKLMLLADFYKQFLEFDYILIYQPDAFVFKNDLAYWCAQGFDYIGAPWLREADYPDLIKKVKNRFLSYVHIKRNLIDNKTGLPSKLQFENNVGNGGFSLRNVDKFHKICTSDEQLINQYLLESVHQFNEDAFWSIEVNRKKNRLNIPGYRVAARFAIENHGDYALKLTHGELPFGCHAWDKNLAFWTPIFRQLHIELPA